MRSMRTAGTLALLFIVLGMALSGCKSRSREEIMTDPGRAPVIEVIVDHRAAHPREITNELKGQPDQDQADDLPDLACR